MKEQFQKELESRTQQLMQLASINEKDRHLVEMCIKGAMLHGWQESRNEHLRTNRFTLFPLHED